MTVPLAWTCVEKGEEQRFEMGNRLDSRMDKEKEQTKDNLAESSC